MSVCVCVAAGVKSKNKGILCVLLAIRPGKEKSQWNRLENIFWILECFSHYLRVIWLKRKNNHKCIALFIQKYVVPVIYCMSGMVLVTRDIM